MAQLLDQHARPLGKTGFRPTARFLRDTKAGVIAGRAGSLVPTRDAVRASWSRSAALAMDLIRNSGRLKGATDQVITDTVGVGLTLTPQPDLRVLGCDEQETRDWSRDVRRRWNAWARNKAECDLRGKLTLAQMVDIAIRWYIAYGEVTGVFDFLGAAQRRRYRVETGTKLLMVPPTKLVQETNDSSGLYQGVVHDDNGRPAAYRFRVTADGLTRTWDYPAFDAEGRPMVLHVFDPDDAEAVRGISPMAPAFRKHIMAEMLDDSTLQMAILQTIFAITLTSDAPSQDAFEAIQALKDEQNSELADGYSAFLLSQLEAAADSRINVGADPQVSHLGPGEDLSLKTANVPGAEYLPFSASLARDMARALGITYSAATMDHSNATYSSVRMETATIWPIAVRRRERVAVPVCQAAYEHWLDEEIGEGRIPLKGGIEAFVAHRASVCAASWQGPAQPTADDYKSARASTERLNNGTSSIEIETGSLGIDADELFEQRQREHRRYVDAGMESPYAASGPAVPPIPVEVEE